MKKINLQLRKGSNKVFNSLPKKERLEIYNHLLEYYKKDPLHCSSGMCGVITRQYNVIISQKASGQSKFSPFSKSWLKGVYVLFDGGLPELLDEYRTFEKNHCYKWGSKDRIPALENAIKKLKDK